MNRLPFRLLGEQLGQTGVAVAQPCPLGARACPPPPPGSAPPAGRSNSRSSTACTSVPRAVAGVGGSGMRSMTRNRYSSGQVMKSDARDGDSAEGGSPAAPKEAARVQVVNRVFDVHSATVGQPTDIQCGLADGHRTRPQRRERAARAAADLLPKGRPGRAAAGTRACRRMHVASVLWQVARRSSRTGASRPAAGRDSSWRGRSASPCTCRRTGSSSPASSSSSTPTTCPPRCSGNTRYVVAAAFVVLLYLSVLVHELAHSVVARGYGLPVRRILLYPLGGISEIEREAPTPRPRVRRGRRGPGAVPGARRGRLGPRPGRHRTA